MGHQGSPLTFYTCYLSVVLIFTIFPARRSSLWGWKVKMKVTQLCRTLCNPMYYTLLRILQARILEWVSFPFSKGSSQPRGWTQSPTLQVDFFPSWATKNKPRINLYIWRAWGMRSGTLLMEVVERDSCLKESEWKEMFPPGLMGRAIFKYPSRKEGSVLLNFSSTMWVQVS